MKLALKSLVAIVLVSMLAFSCKKDKDRDKEKTRQELLTNKWRVTDVKLGGTSILPFAEELQCVTDNILTLTSEGNFTMEEGANVCSIEFEGNGTWSLVENDTKIKLNFADTEEEALIPILELTASVLRVTYNIPDAPIPGEYELVLQRQ